MSDDSQNCRYEDFEKALADPEYLEKIRPDEENFVDHESITVTVGTEVVVIEEEKAVDGHKKIFWDETRCY